MNQRRIQALSQLLLLLITSQSGLCASVAGEQLTRVMAGELQLTLLSGAGGIRIDRLLDRKYGQDLLTTNPLPLFSLTLQRAGSTNRLNLRADTGWSQCSIQPHGSRLKMHWSLPLEKGLAGLSVTAEVSPEIRTGAFRWKLRVGNTSTNWSVRRTVFPQVALADLGTNAVVLVPRGPGVLERGVWHRPFGFGGTYPNGWCSMQFMAAYRDGDRPAGLYVATHDPWGSTKDLSVKSEPTTHTMRLSFDHPAPDLGRAGNDFVLPGEAVWQLLRGDWFDAAMIYKHWAQREAKWWPRLARDGRKDTPRWMRDLNVWAMNLGAPDECVPAIKQFRDFLGMPLGFHWYNWHQIPFDNDYPHYFPTRAGFDQGVADLQSVGVFVMPYINGRLWDSHDRGADDFQFSRLALAAVARRDDGSPYLETYNSKETNGEPVRLGVMCPATPLWQNTVSNIVLRLLSECGTSAVYIDQVAAASPVLCQNPAHGHPLGGGHWWNGSYWKMLGAIRQVMPPGVALTTECNAEPFIRWFDGYLTWHWQFPGQVPAFPAIYGGAIQMFGRAYRGGATKDLALRMKAGQQLVFGEQLGWLDPGAVKEPENARFFREMARLRSQLSRYFSAGEMARPPRLLDSVPTVRADWQWSGEWWVTTEAVLTGAWKLPREKRMVLLFVNVGDKPVPNRVQFDAAANGIRGRMLRAQRRTADGHKTEWEKWPAVFDRAVTFPPRQAEAWELKW